MHLFFHVSLSYFLHLGRTRNRLGAMDDYSRAKRWVETNVEPEEDGLGTFNRHCYITEHMNKNKKNDCNLDDIVSSGSLGFFTTINKHWEVLRLSSPALKTTLHRQNSFQLTQTLKWPNLPSDFNGTFVYVPELNQSRGSLASAGLRRHRWRHSPSGITWRTLRNISTNQLLWGTEGFHRCGSFRSRGRW